MDHHSYAACAVFLRFSKSFRTRHELHAGILETFKYIYQPEKKMRQTSPSLYLSASFESCTRSQSPRVATVTKIARSRHPIPETVGTFEIAKCQKRRQTRRLRAFMAPPPPRPGWGGAQERQTPDHICKSLALRARLAQIFSPQRKFVLPQLLAKERGTENGN